MTKISNFEDQQPKPGDVNAKRSYLTYNKFYELSHFIIPAELPVGKWIQLRDMEFKHDITPFESCKIKHKITVKINHGSHVLLDGNEEANTNATEHFSQQCFKSIQSLIEYNSNIRSYKNSKFRRTLFDSMSQLFTTSQQKRASNSFCALCRIDEKNHYMSKDDKKWNYTFNINAENIRFSVIKWDDCRAYSDFIGDQITPNKAVIFCKLDVTYFSRNKPYFKITPNSFILYDFCTDIRKVLEKGIFGNQECQNIDYLWTNPNEQGNYLIFNQITMKSFPDLKSAVKYVRVNIKRKLSCLFSIRSCHITNVSNVECNFKCWCKKCHTVSNGLYAKCCNKPRIRNSRWLHASVVINFNNTPHSNSNTNTHEEPTASKLVLLTKHSLKAMYQYCQMKKIKDENLDATKKLVIDYLDGKTKYSNKSRSDCFKPLIQVFWETIIHDHSKKLSLQISGQVLKTGKILPRFTLEHIKDCKCDPTPNNNNNGKIQANIKRKISNTKDTEFPPPPKKRMKLEHSD